MCYISNNSKASENTYNNNPYAINPSVIQAASLSEFKELSAEESCWVGIPFEEINPNLFSKLEFAYVLSLRNFLSEFPNLAIYLVGGIFTSAIFNFSKRAKDIDILAKAKTFQDLSKIHYYLFEKNNQKVKIHGRYFQVEYVDFFGGPYAGHMQVIEIKLTPVFSNISGKNITPRVINLSLACGI